MSCIAREEERQACTSRRKVGYVLKVWEQRGAVNTTLVVAGTKGIVESLDRTQLVEYGGDITLTTSWAKSLLKKMNFTKRRATTKCSIPPHVFRDIKTKFLQSMIDMVKMEEIPLFIWFMPQIGQW